MGWQRILFFLLLFIATGTTQAQTDAKEPRILILLDGSSSMLQPWSKDNIRFKTAGDIIISLIDSMYRVNDQVEFALRVYGHQSPAQENNCFDTKREVMFSKDNLTQMSLRLASLQPRGVSPIARSIKEAAEIDMSDSRYAYSLILVTDGGESCGGDICDIVEKLLKAKINFKPYIIGLVDYAPLKEQYACLGNYLLVTKETDIPVAVKKIVDDYRPMLLAPKIDKKLLQTAVVNSPSVLKVDIPKFKVQQEKEEPVKQEPPKEQPKPAPKPAPKPKPAEIEPPKVQPAPAIDLTIRTVTPKPTAPAILTESIAPLAGTKARNITTQPLNTSLAFRTVSIAKFTPAPADPVDTPPATQPAGPSTLVVAKDPAGNTTVLPNKPTPTPAPKPTPTPKPVAKVTAPPAKEKDANFTVNREEAKETTLEVFFTNGKGKFYQTTPQILLLDPKTNKEVSKFYRTVDAAGNPDPKQLPVGLYNLTVAGKTNLLVKNVEIKPNNKNKVVIQVNKSSLKFTYADNPNRPVSEYFAIVNRRFEQGPTIKQACTQELEYDPGNFYIEVNTLPVLRRNLDLELETIYNLIIPEDGFLDITNTNNVGKVALYTPLGDKYVKFHEMTVTGIGSQKLTLQPGVYEAHFLKHPEIPVTDETVVPFRIKSNETTSVQLQ